MKKRGSPLTPAERQERSRARGRPVSTVLRDAGAIAALDRLTEAKGSQRAALEHALRLASKLSPSKAS